MNAENQISKKYAYNIRKIALLAPKLTVGTRYRWGEELRGQSPCDGSVGAISRDQAAALFVIAK